MRKILPTLFAVLWATTLVDAVAAAPKPAPPKPEGPAAEHVSLGRAVVTKLRIGFTMRPGGSPVSNIRAQVPVPIECDEQKVEIVDDEFSDQVSGDHRILPMGVARQLVLFARNVDAGQAARGLVTYEVRTFEVMPPTATDKLHVPVRIDKSLKPYLMASPYVEVGNRKIKAAVAKAKAAAASAAPKSGEIGSATSKAIPAGQPALESPFAKSAGGRSPTIAGAQADASAKVTPTPTLTDWRRIESFYDYALKHVKYVESDDKSAVKALEDGKGDCYAVAALFVAMCRTDKAPARMIWADGHQYAEFYLEDSANAGHWYPIESAGTRSFGGQPTPRVILQKGDNFRVPERRGESLRYANEYIQADAVGGERPKITPIREKL